MNQIFNSFRRSGQPEGIYHYYDYEEEQRRDGVFAEFFYPVLHPAGHHQASDTEHHRAECQGFVAGGQEFAVIQIERAEKIFH